MTNVDRDRYDILMTTIFCKASELMKEGQNMRYTIEIDELQTKIKELGEELIIVDVRTNREAGEMVGAVVLDVKRDISGEAQFFAEPEIIAKRLGEIGIDERKTVVFIDNGTNRQSAKVLFAFYQLGHQGGLQILQGGYDSWQEAPIELDYVQRPAVTYAYNLRKDSVFTFDTIKEALANETVALIDSRSYERYAGIKELKYKKAGHIPGAINFHAKNVFDESGKWHDKSELKKIFSSLNDKKKVIASCGSGGSACLNAVALLEAGFEDVALYPGGYSEWLDEGEAVATVEDVESDRQKE